MEISSKQITLAICYYALALAGTLGILHVFNIVDLLNTQNFLNADALHYYTIKESGYVHFNQAFFPLFPILWSIVDLAPNLITIINGIIFLFSAGFLIKSLEPKSMLQVFIYLAIPSGIFYFLPFSEAAFFAASSMILLGLKREKTQYIYVGLFLACLSRPAFTVLLPGLIIVEFLSQNRTKIWMRILGYVISAGVGVFLVTLIQHHFTGEWLQFFTVQKYWGNELGIPSLPLRSWGDDFVARVDGIALLFGGIAGFMLLLELVRKKRARKQYPKHLVLSLAYLGGIALMVFFYRDGSLFSLNRFVFATPFAIVAMHYFFNAEFQLKWKHLGVAMLGLLGYWLLFGSYVHIQTFLKYAAVSLIPILFLATRLSNQNMRRIAFILLLATFFTFQMVFFVRILNGLWIA